MMVRKRLPHLKPKNQIVMETVRPAKRSMVVATPAQQARATFKTHSPNACAHTHAHTHTYLVQISVFLRVMKKSITHAQTRVPARARANSHMHTRTHTCTQSRHAVGRFPRLVQDFIRRKTRHSLPETRPGIWQLGSAMFRSAYAHGLSVLFSTVCHLWVC